MSNMIKRIVNIAFEVDIKPEDEDELIQYLQVYIDLRLPEWFGYRPNIKNVEVVSDKHHNKNKMNKNKLLCGFCDFRLSYLSEDDSYECGNPECDEVVIVRVVEE